MLSPLAPATIGLGSPYEQRRRFDVQKVENGFLVSATVERDDPHRATLDGIGSRDWSRVDAEQMKEALAMAEAIAPKHKVPVTVYFIAATLDEVQQLQRRYFSSGDLDISNTDA